MSIRPKDQKDPASFMPSRKDAENNQKKKSHIYSMPLRQDAIKNLSRFQMPPRPESFVGIHNPFAMPIRQLNEVKSMPYRSKSAIQ
jgi:hypothetical protein